MNNQYYDRYQSFVKDDGTFEIIPGIEIPIKSTDKYVSFKSGVDRLDKYSQEYYGSPLFGWLILLANPLAGSIEFLIPNKFMIRIPFPLVPSLQDYRNNVELYKMYYGE